MTSLIPVALILLAALALLIGAGREAMRLAGRPAGPSRHPAELVPILKEGWTALNAASAEAARLQMTRGHW